MAPTGASVRSASRNRPSCGISPSSISAGAGTRKWVSAIPGGGMFEAWGRGLYRARRGTTVSVYSENITTIIGLGLGRHGRPRAQQPHAVPAGLPATRRCRSCSSLVLLLIIVVGLFSASGIAFMKLLGVGMIVALVVDATVVRILLVPATMRLLGRANWWAPARCGGCTPATASGKRRRQWCRWGETRDRSDKKIL